MSELHAVQALAFDLDGTLVDSVPGLAAALDLTFADFNLAPVGVARVTQWIGNGADALIAQALRWVNYEPSAEIFLRIRACFDNYYTRTATSGSRLFPQVKETLARLNEHGYPMALVTNKPSIFVKPLLVSLGIAEYFQIVIGGDDISQKKPHPAAVYLVLAKFGLYANQLLFIGDSRNDIQAARAAGCLSVGLTYGYNFGEAIALSQPNYILTRFADLLPTLGLLPLES